MEFSITQQIKTGIFVVLGLVLIVLSILLLGDEKTSLTGTYDLRVKLKQVQGLSPGSQVTLSGLRVGRISKIDFSNDSSDLIATLEISKPNQKRITAGAIAAVKTLGALGDKYIYISPGPADAKPLQDGDLLPSDGGEDFIDIIARKSADLSNVVDVVNQLNVLLSNLNEGGRSRILLENLIQVTAEMRALAADLRGSMNKDKLHQSVDRLSSILGKIDKGDGTLGALINDPSLHQKLSSLLGSTPRSQFLKPLIRETIQHQERGSKAK